MDFILFPESSMVPRRYSFMEQREQSRLSDLVELIYYEMPKLKHVVKGFLEERGNRGNIGSLSAEEKWCIFFKYKQYEEMRPLIEELCREEEGIMLADKRIDKLSRRSEKWARALFRDKAEMDYGSNLYAARVKGKAEGIEEGTAKGLAKAKADAARNMKVKGYPVGDIQDITGLSPQEIEKL